MQILTYDQLDHKERLLPVFYRGFGYAFDPRRFEERRAQDPVFKDGPAIFCALVDGVPSSVVGVMELPTRTMHGQENVGALWSVITHPAYARRGLATALLEHVHNYFRGRGLRMVFLSTNSSWGAYNLYRKLGYQNVPMAGSVMAYKILPPPESTDAVPTLPRATEEAVAALFQRFTASRTGFVVRPPGFMRLRTEFGPLKEEMCIQTEAGYALAGEWRGNVGIQEMVALNDSAQHALLEALEGCARSVVDRLVTSDNLRRVYQERGYSFDEERYAVLMVKTLEQGLDVEKVYGEGFYISALERLW